MEAAKIVAQTEESLAGNKSYYSEDRFSRGNTRGNNKRNKYKSNDWKSGRSRGHDKRPRYREDARETIDRIGYKKAVKDDNRDKHWTPLTKTPKEVLMTENHDFKAPRPMTNKKGQDPNLYCDFHKDSGHLTDDCYSLCQEIERALKSGKLSHLVKNVRKETRQLQRHDEGNHKKVRRLETHMVNGPRYSAKEKGKRPYEPSWQEQQVIFPVVRGGPVPHDPSSLPVSSAIMKRSTYLLIREVQLTSFTNNVLTNLMKKIKRDSSQSIIPCPDFATRWFSHSIRSASPSRFLTGNIQEQQM
ncbi:hypothetical protein HanRHA438_Chr10g0457131 [Helianthus annuus]|nr:hypothetical protein HanRHA438_Chr10g0457131 [Helianthus annuus]